MPYAPPPKVPVPTNSTLWVTGNAFASGFASWVAQGQPLNSFRGYRQQGIFQTAADIDTKRDGTAAKPGDIKWKDINGDGVINSSDQEILGGALPKFFGSFTNNFTNSRYSCDDGC